MVRWLSLWVIVVLGGGTTLPAQTPVWDVVERCVEPITPPAGWTLPGAILIQDQAGLFHVTAAGDTSKLFIPADRFSTDRAGYVAGMRLSPDGEWLAVLRGTLGRDGELTMVHVQTIAVFSTQDRDQVMVHPWAASWATHWGGRVPFWLDGETLLFDYAEFPQPTPALLSTLNPFTGEVREWPGRVGITEVGSAIAYSPAPDFGVTLEVYRGMGGDPPGAVLRDIQTGGLLGQLAVELASMLAVWQPNSRFAMMEISEVGTRLLARLDMGSETPSGAVVDRVFNLGEDRVGSVTWAPNAQWMAFTVRDSENPARLYLADFAAQQVINPCLTVSGPAAWSQETPQVALLSADQHTVLVLDIDSWTLVTAATHDPGSEEPFSHLIGWRASE